MVSAKWTCAVTALAWAGLAWGQTPPTPPAAKTGVDLMTVQEAGKPGQKCLILKSWKDPEGSLVFEVQSIATGERLTIVEIGPGDSAAWAPSRGMRSRIYHWGESTTPPSGVPQPPVEKPAQPAGSSAPAATPAPVPIIKSAEGLSPALSDNSATFKTPPSEAPTPVSNEKSTPEVAGSSVPNAALSPIQMETAKPSDWHQSWGKADDHKSHLSSEAAPAACLPVSGSTTEDSDMGKAKTSAPEAVLSVPKPGPEPAGCVSITDIPPRSKLKAEANRPIRRIFTSASKPVQQQEPIPGPSMPGSAIAAVGATSVSADPHQLQLVMCNDLMPSRREKAAELLSTMDWHRNNEILPAILQTAGTDPAATVRLTCIRCLVQMKADTSETIHVLHSLKTDADPRVRGEADQALAFLGVLQTEPDEQPVHQISAPVPAEPK